MKHYTSPNGELFAYELDGSQDHLIPENFVVATQAEVDAIQNPPIDPKEAIRAQITSLEQAQLMPRATREFMLLFVEQNNLTAMPGYAPLKAFDAQIVALRNQL